MKNILRKTKITKIMAAMFAVVLCVAMVTIGERANAAYYCRTDACREAQEREEKYQALANQSTLMANTYEAAVANLNNEIALLEASIAKNQALAKDIAEEIEETEEKLHAEQSALAELLISMHFEGNAEPIKILAGADSISDLAEKQAREEVVKKSIAAASEKVKALKNELEEQKATIDSLIEADEQKSAEVAAKRAEQKALVTKFQNDAASYQAEADAAAEERRQLMEVIAEETATCQYTGYTTTMYPNYYPLQDSCPAWPNYYPYGGMMCQCTSYAGYMAYRTYGVTIRGWGNAKNWGWDYYGNPLSYKEGYRVDTVVEAGTVAVSNCGEYGHVMWVEQVNADGTINVTEYNNYGSNIYHRLADFGARTNVSVAGLRFIHFH